jgi:hypothetical protein
VVFNLSGYFIGFVVHIAQPTYVYNIRLSIGEVKFSREKEAEEIKKLGFVADTKL